MSSGLLSGTDDEGSRMPFFTVRRCAAAGSALAIVGAMRRSGEEAKGALCFPGIFP